MKKFFIVLCILCLSLILYSVDDGHDKKIEDATKDVAESVCMLTEEKVTNKELKNMSDLIIEGSITKKVKEFEYEDEYASSIVSYYLCNVDKKIQGECDNQIYINYGGTVLPESVQYNEKVTLYLVKSGFKEEGKDVYCFSSIN